LKWFCDQCEGHFDKIKIEIKQISEKQKILEGKHERLDGEVKGMKMEIGEMRKNLDQIVKEKENKREEVQGTVITEMQGEIVRLKKTYSEMVGDSQMEGARSSGVNPQNRNMQVEVSEAMEREKRRNNLVLFGIQETNDEGITREKVKEIVEAVGIEEGKVKYFGRVGRNSVTNKMRVVRVVCEDVETKRKFLKSANKLKQMEGFDKIYVSLDLTKMQQLQDKKLQDKLREIRVENREAKINNGEIITFENGARKILYTLQH